MVTSCCWISLHPQRFNESGAGFCELDGGCSAARGEDRSRGRPLSEDIHVGPGAHEPSTAALLGQVILDREMIEERSRSARVLLEVHDERDRNLTGGVD